VNEYAPVNGVYPPNNSDCAILKLNVSLNEQ